MTSSILSGSLVGRRRKIESAPTMTLVVAAFSALFLIYHITAPGGGAMQTFAGAFAGASVGIWLFSVLISEGKNRSYIAILFLLAFVLRIWVGVEAYLIQDPGYFSGDGGYREPVDEYRLTYDAAIKVATAILEPQDAAWYQVLNNGDSKNPFIHSWMGLFLADGQSRNFMDLSVFNAFHQICAGLVLVALGSRLGYARNASLASGLVIAFYPWALPASVMWRDPVGLFFTVLALYLTCIHRRILIAGLLLGPAVLLAYANRTAYLIVPIVAFVSSQVQGDPALRERLGRNVLPAIFAGGVVAAFGLQYWQDVILSYSGGGDYQAYTSKIVYLPVLILRAIIGPFPWILSDQLSASVAVLRLGDFAFHVLQFAAIVALLRNWSAIRRAMDPLMMAGFILWAEAILASGIHTAYLAAALPFFLPAIFTHERAFVGLVVVSAAAFALLNVLYNLAGIQGSGILISLTGY